MCVLKYIFSDSNVLSRAEGCASGLKVIEPVVDILHAHCNSGGDEPYHLTGERGTGGGGLFTM